MNFEEVLRIHVAVDGAAIVSLTDSDGRNVTMIPFGGVAEGKYFNGRIMPGGVDTQVSGIGGGDRVLSAKYMLEGKDIEGNNCRIFIDNTGRFSQIPNTPMFRTNPIIITDSRALRFLQDDFLVSEGVSTDIGVDIVIRRCRR